TVIRGQHHHHATQIACRLVGLVERGDTRRLRVSKLMGFARAQPILRLLRSPTRYDPAGPSSPPNLAPILASILASASACPVSPRQPDKAITVIMPPSGTASFHCAGALNFRCGK